MIKTLNIHKIASYKNLVPISLENKKLALFYGLNGSGKSSITNYLLAYSKGDPLPSKYSSCSVEWDSAGEKEIVVYNSQFVTSVFYENKEQQGIFSLGEKNVDAERQIELDKKEIEKKQPLYDAESQATKKCKDDIDNEFQKIKNKVFKIKQDFEKKELDFCLKGAKNKDDFWTKLRNVVSAPAETIINIEDLKIRAKLLENPPEPKKTFNLISEKFAEMESNDLWNESIIGTGDSYLKELIDSLHNLDWFRTGYAYYVEKADGKCPFCQQILPNGFKEECEKIFDLVYKNKIQQLDGLFQQYERSYHYAISFDETQIDDIELTKSVQSFRDLYEKNKTLINEKRRNPSVQIKLAPLDAKVSEINEILTKINEEANIFNSRLGNPQKEKDEINSLFWQWVEKKYHDDLIQYDEKIKNFDGAMKTHQEKASEYKRDIGALEQDILVNTEKLVSMQATITNINAEIDSLGLSDFHIVENPENPGHFKIKRDEAAQTEDSDDVYKTLSEGEKTLITFLYFLELCKGGVDKRRVNALVNKIIVIDDPISSLSQNYVYEISYLIANTFTQGKNIIPEQLLIFTHNLYFFYEISEHQLDKYLKKYEKASSGPYPFFRIRKNKSSEIVPMGKDEIQNDYQSSWLLYKECLEGKAPVRLLPNTMRNILEYYFSFVKRKGKLQKALEELSCEEADFKPFYRFINRGSHSDIVNISEFKDIDTGKYQVLFKKIFEKTGFVDHYNAMMGVEPAEEGT